jgi:hypothetical protein
MRYTKENNIESVLGGFFGLLFGLSVTKYFQEDFDFFYRIIPSTQISFLKNYDTSLEELCAISSAVGWFTIGACIGSLINKYKENQKQNEL